MCNVNTGSEIIAWVCSRQILAKNTELQIVLKVNILHNSMNGLGSKLRITSVRLYIKSSPGMTDVWIRYLCT
jgi:hypothetical protein